LPIGLLVIIKVYVVKFALFHDCQSQ
jgi:hypothetical protein